MALRRSITRGRWLYSTLLGVVGLLAATMPGVSAATAADVLQPGPYSFFWGAAETGPVCETDGTWTIDFYARFGWSIPGVPPEMLLAPTPTEITGFELGGLASGNHPEYWDTNPVPAANVQFTNAQVSVPGDQPGVLTARLSFRDTDGNIQSSPAAGDPPYEIDLTGPPCVPKPNTFTTEIIVNGAIPAGSEITTAFGCGGPFGTGPTPIQAGTYAQPVAVEGFCSFSAGSWVTTPAGTRISRACSTTGDAVCGGTTSVDFGDLGTGKITITITIPSADPGRWLESNSLTSPTVATTFRWGDGAAQVLACDTDGNGRDGPVMFRAGVWWIATTETPTTRSYKAPAFTYGKAGDIAVCGDWNGDGRDGIGLYRPSEGGRWRLRNSASAGPSSAIFFYGRTAGDKPVVGDWDADGRDEPGVFRSGRWYLGNLSGSTVTTVRTFTYGRAGDIPLAGDWNGNGIDGIGLRRASTQRFYLRNSPTGGVSNYSAMWGRSSDLPIAGNWNSDKKDSYGLVRSEPLPSSWSLK